MRWRKWSQEVRRKEILTLFSVVNPDNRKTLENRREEEKIVLDGQREKESHESRGEREIKSKKVTR